MIASRKIYTVNDSQVMHDTINGEVILIHMDSGNYYSIDLVGADVWNLISNKRTTDQIVADILLRYEGETEVVDESVCTFLSQLEKEGLIVHGETPISSSITTVNTNTPPSQDEKPTFTPPTLEIYSDMQDLLLLDPIHEVDEAGWPSTGAK
jgi:hypothetical protein